MNFHFKIQRHLVGEIHADLRRPHSVAYERVGFIKVGFARSQEGILILAADYRAVADEDYVFKAGVGATIKAEAISKAMDWALETQAGIFHVHAHTGRGRPVFSPTDVQTNARLVPAFFNVSPNALHGAVLLTDNQLGGSVWTTRTSAPQPFRRVTVVGAPIWVQHL